MKFAQKTDIGHLRQTNEDSTTAIENKNGDVLSLICDGMGGHLGGFYASSKAIELFEAEFKSAPVFNKIRDIYDWIYQTTELVNRELFNKSNRDNNYKGMGTTMVCCVITEKHRVYANIGDSRIYKLENKEMVQLSEDQTLVGALLKAGYLSKEEAASHPKRSMLLNALGTNPQLDIQINSFELKKGYLLLCSDGLYNMLSEEEIESVLGSKKGVREKVDILIQMANDAGGKDNITVNIVEVGY